MKPYPFLLGTGHMMESEKFWKFGNSTKNASNQITDEDAFLGLEINVDRESYSFGDTASITGKVSKIVTDPAAYDTPSSMTLIISGLGSEQTISLYPDNNNLEFKYDISLQPTLGFEFGARIQLMHHMDNGLPEHPLCL